MIPAIVLESLLTGDEAGALAVLDELDRSELGRITAAAVRLADLAAPHHHCADCGRWTPLDLRVVPGRPHAVGTAPPMRCTTCANPPTTGDPGT